MYSAGKISFSNEIEDDFLGASLQSPVSENPSAIETESISIKNLEKGDYLINVYTDPNEDAHEVEFSLELNGEEFMRIYQTTPDFTQSYLCQPFLV